MSSRSQADRPASAPPALFVRLPHSWCGASLDAIDAVAAAAERLGFAGVSVQDHLLSGHAVAPCGHRHAEDDRIVFEPFSTLAYVAARTTRVRLLTGVLVLPHRHPVWVAKTGATVDVLSRGRLILGVGIGAPRGRQTDGRQNMAPHSDIASREHELIALPGPRPAVMDESLEVIDRLWREDVVTRPSDIYPLDEVDMRPLPVQRPRPPIWVGGRAEAALRRAALLADGWFPSQAPLDVFEAGVARVRELAAEAGRPAPRFAVNLFISVDRDGDRAREIVRDGLGHRFRGEEALAAATIAGSPAEAIDRIRAYAAAGAAALDLKFLPLDTASTIEQMELVAAEVAPAL